MFPCFQPYFMKNVKHQYRREFVGLISNKCYFLHNKVTQYLIEALLLFLCILRMVKYFLKNKDNVLRIIALSFLSSLATKRMKSVIHINEAQHETFIFSATLTPVNEAHLEKRKITLKSLQHNTKLAEVQDSWIFRCFYF